MNKEAKKERRDLRHKLQRECEKHAGDFRLRATTRQLRAAGKTLADRILAGQDPHSVVRYGDTRG